LMAPTMENTWTESRKIRRRAWQQNVRKYVLRPTYWVRGNRMFFRSGSIA